MTRPFMRHDENEVETDQQMEDDGKEYNDLEMEVDEEPAMPEIRWRNPANGSQLQGAAERDSFLSDYSNDDFDADNVKDDDDSLVNSSDLDDEFPPDSGGAFGGGVGSRGTGVINKGFEEKHFMIHPRCLSIVTEEPEREAAAENAYLRDGEALRTGDKNDGTAGAEGVGDDSNMAMSGAVGGARRKSSAGKRKGSSSARRPSPATIAEYKEDDEAAEKVGIEGQTRQTE